MHAKVVNHNMLSLKFVMKFELKVEKLWTVIFNNK